MPIKFKRSWYRDAKGNVFNANADPSRKEYYRETVLHNNFKEVHKPWLLLKPPKGADFVFVYSLGFSFGDGAPHDDGCGYWKLDAGSGMTLFIKS